MFASYTSFSCERTLKLKTLDDIFLFSINFVVRLTVEETKASLDCHSTSIHLNTHDHVNL